MKAYEDKTTNKWKWGTRGKAIYNSKSEAEQEGLKILTDRLRHIKDKLSTVILNRGK